MDRPTAHVERCGPIQQRSLDVLAFNLEVVRQSEICRRPHRLAKQGGRSASCRVPRGPRQLCCTQAVLRHRWLARQPSPAPKPSWLTHVALLRKLTSLTHVASWSGRRVRPPRAQGRRWPSCPCCMCSVAPRPRPPRTSRASGAPLLALGRYGRSNGLMQMALSQRCWSWLAAISGGKPLVMDSTSTLGGYLIIGLWGRL